jgi:hypothetical protein
MLRKVTASLLALGVAATVSAQSPCFDLALGTNLALTDDSNSAALPLGFSFTYNGVTYTDICVSSNGYIWLGPVAGAADFSPTEAELLAQAPRICPMWTDLNPGAAGSGQVYYDASVPGVAKITWAGVFQYNTTNQNSVQVVIDASSSVTITYGPCTTAANPIVGASPGLGSISNPVSLATRPVVITQNNFAEVITAAAGTPFVYSNTKMLWSPTSPGYLISDVSCTPNSLPVPATSQSVGIGCPAPAGPSLYETFGAANAADLSGLNLTLLPSGTTDYIALPNLSPAWFSGFTANLLAGDDTTHLVTLPFSFPYNGGVETQIYVSSNGFFTLGATNPGSGCCTGNIATMLAGSPRLSGWWEDLDAVHGADLVEAGAVDRDFVHFQAGAPQGGGHHGPGLQADFALRVGAALQEQDTCSEQGAGVGCRHGSPPCECPAPFRGVGRCRGLRPRRGARRLPRARAVRPCA